jgi:hypothetical protein
MIKKVIYYILGSIEFETIPRSRFSFFFFLNGGLIVPFFSLIVPYPYNCNLGKKKKNDFIF